MSTFEYLLLGHLVGDWLLQNDWMAIGKRQRALCVAGMVHYSIYTSVILLMLWWPQRVFNSPTTLLLCSGVIFLSHWLIDASNLVQWWMHKMGQRDQAMVRIVIDQTLHLLVLAFLATSYLPATL